MVLEQIKRWPSAIVYGDNFTVDQGVRLKLFKGPSDPRELGCKYVGSTALAYMGSMNFRLAIDPLPADRYRFLNVWSL